MIDLIDSVVNHINNLRTETYTISQWIDGIDMDIFKEEFQLVSDTQIIQAKFDMTMATEDQKREFVEKCIQSYKDTIENQNQLVWKTFQLFLISQLQIPKYKFKAMDWRSHFKECEYI